MRTIILLTISNIFMTFAWYGHLRFRESPLWMAIVVSWMIAFFEYCFQVPANRIGADRFSPVQLKVIQEVITLIVFCVFVTFYFGEHLRWNHAVSAAFLVGAVFFAFRPALRTARKASRSATAAASSRACSASLAARASSSTVRWRARDASGCGAGR